MKLEYTVLEVPVTGWWWGGVVDSQALKNKLNELEKNGWQVVAMNETNMWRGASRNLIVILKREL